MIPHFSMMISINKVSGRTNNNATNATLIKIVVSIGFVSFLFVIARF